MPKSGRADSMDPITQSDIIAAARQCLETPFRHQGRLLSFGLDCAGVVIHICRTLGIDAVDAVGYGRTPHDNQLQTTLDAQPVLVRVPDIADRQPGDLLLMRFATDPQHLAIFAGSTIIHAHEASGKVVEHVLSPVWASRIVAAYRFRGVA